MGFNLSKTITEPKIDFCGHNADYDPACIFKVKVNEFNVEEIIQNINEIDIPKSHLNKITEKLDYIRKKQDETLCDQVDFIIIENKTLPLLEIHNQSALENRKKKGHNNNDRIYSITVDLN